MGEGQCVCARCSNLLGEAHHKKVVEEAEALEIPEGVEVGMPAVEASVPRVIRSEKPLSDIEVARHNISHPARSHAL